MKKKNSSTATGSKTDNVAAVNYTRRPNPTPMQQYNISKYFGGSNSSSLPKGNIYGEREDDYYSHA